MDHSKEEEEYQEKIRMVLAHLKDVFKREYLKAECQLHRDKRVLKIKGLKMHLEIGGANTAKRHYWWQRSNQMPIYVKVQKHSIHSKDKNGKQITAGGQSRHYRLTHTVNDQIWLREDMFKENMRSLVQKIYQFIDAIEDFGMIWERTQKEDPDWVQAYNSDWPEIVVSNWRHRDKDPVQVDLQ